MIRRLAVVGVGLLGGSVAKAVRAANLAESIVGIGRDRERLLPAQRDGALDQVATAIAPAVQDADFIVLAAPVGAIERALPEVWAAAPAEALITDVGSTKARIVAAAERLTATRPLGFVGSHPMAGSERSGYAAARADLFRGATVILTPTDSTEPRALKGVTAFWEALGAQRVPALDPRVHDQVVAAISHLPHVVAFALVEAVARFEPAAFEFAAGGFRDTTRIAASHPEVWKEILLSNWQTLAPALAAFRAALGAIEQAIGTGDSAGLVQILARVKAQREALR